MTHPYGKGTTNIPINVPIRERRLLGRMAASRRMSTGALIKSLYLRGMLAESPTDAAILIRVRHGRGATTIQIL